jgi:exodeoxyribonuclease V gamma subunit
MIQLVTSNRTERLVQALVEKLAGRADPLSPIPVVVPNLPVERWLEMRIAERLGIAANLRFVRLERFVVEQIERAQRAAGAEPRPILDVARLEGVLLAVMLDCEALARDADLAPLRDWLSSAGDDEDARERRIASMASRMARLYWEYQLFRADMIERWSSGALELGDTRFAATERWQRALFRLARDRDPEAIEVAAALQALRARGRRLDDEAPREAHVFGISYVARVFHQAFAAIAERLELHIYALNPCREFWEDALSDAEVRRALRRSRAHPEEDPFALTAEVDNPLLRAWGKPGREHLALLDQMTGWHGRSEFEDPGEGTLLARIQSAILRRAPIAPGPIDRSVRLLACPSIRREVETVAAAIWELIDRTRGSERPYRFHDVAVLVHGAERDRYLPHLEAVFAEARNLPWNAGDLALATRSRVVDCALRLIELPGSSFTRAEVLEVVAHPLLLARWPDADPARAADLCDRLGVFHGIDARDHRGTYLEPTGLVHWDQALRRLALGAVMEGERNGAAEPFIGPDGTRLYPEETDRSDHLATGLGLLVRSLASDARFARHARMRLAAWGRFFAEMLRAYLVPTSAAEESELRRCTAALAELASRDAGVEVGYRIAVELARAELASLPAVRGDLLGDGVVVASLLPMRAIPFRAIFVLGLGEGRFPARELETGLDLRAARRRPGDVAVDERDRYAFLETLLSAREELVLSWVARDERSGEAREPSSIVLEIEEAIGVRLPRQTPPLRRHELALQPGITPIEVHALPAIVREAEARAAGAPHRLHYAAVPFPVGALARLAPHDARRELLAFPWVPRGERAPRNGARETVTIPQIRSFLECPIQGHARRVLGMDDELPDTLATDEPFKPERLEEERVLADVFAEAIASPPERLDAIYGERASRSAARGRWPLGTIAESLRGQHRKVLDAWLAGFARWGPGTALHRLRFGRGGEGRDAAVDRARDPLTIALADGRVDIEITGRTEWLLPSGDTLITTQQVLQDNREETRVDRLRFALRAFVDHALLSLASTGGGSGPRRAWILDASGGLPIAVHFAPMGAPAAERWLAGVIDDLVSGPHGRFLPCEAVLCVEALFTRGASNPSDVLARSIEEVRDPKRCSSRSGPVRDAIAYPAPEPAEALAIASRRFAAFFEHLRGIERSR